MTIITPVTFQKKQPAALLNMYMYHRKSGVLVFMLRDDACYNLLFHNKHTEKSVLFWHKNVCQTDVSSLTHLHVCQIGRYIKTTHVLTRECAELLVCYSANVIFSKCAGQQACYYVSMPKMVCKIGNMSRPVARIS